MHSSHWNTPQGPRAGSVTTPDRASDRPHLGQGYLSGIDAVPAMKCLSVRQPWAWAIIFGPKRIENRSRPTRHRGPLLIHVALSRAEFAKGRDDSSVLPGLPPVDKLPFGQVIGLVDVVDCLPLAATPPGPFAKGPWCWILADPRPVEPFPFRGALSLFNVPTQLVRPLAPRSAPPGP